MIVRWNFGAQSLFGYSGDEVLGRHFELLFTPADIEAQAPVRELAEALTGPATGHDRWHVRKDGSHFWGMNTAQPLYDAEFTLIGFTKIVRDLTVQYLATQALRESAAQLHVLVEKSQHAALHDDLTGLANKRLFREYVRRAYARAARRPPRTFAVLFLDLDHFKSVNDRLGHILADRLLALVAQRLRQAVRKEDVLARFGGDEFAVLIEDVAGIREAIAIAEHVIASFRAPFAIERTELVVSVSIGIAVASDVEDDSHGERLLEDADYAMYEAKANGRARLSLYRDAMRSRAEANVAVNNDLHLALERGEVSLFYRPIVELRGRVVTGFKAAVRWQHARHGLVSPAALRETRAAEQLLDIERWGISEAARQLHDWQSRFDRPQGLSMTLSLDASQIERPGFAEELRCILASSASSARSFAIDILGVLPMDNFEDVARHLTAIRTVGLGIELDVFAAGTVSLSYLSRLPATTLKIDPIFVRNLQNGVKDVAVVGSMIALARGLGLRSAADGVESNEQFETLRHLGCDEAAGPLFSEAVPAEVAGRLLEHG